MKYLELVARAGCADEVSAIAENLEVADFRLGIERSWHEAQMILSDAIAKVR
jgi:hypothetical protein